MMYEVSRPTDDTHTRLQRLLSFPLPHEYWMSGGAAFVAWMSGESIFSFASFFLPFFFCFCCNTSVGNWPPKTHARTRWRNAPLADVVLRVLMCVGGEKYGVFFLSSSCCCCSNQPTAAVAAAAGNNVYDACSLMRKLTGRGSGWAGRRRRGVCLTVRGS